MQPDREDPAPPGYRYVTSPMPGGSGSVRYLEEIPIEQLDRSIPMATTEGKFVPTPPSIDQMKYELSQQKTASDLGEYLLNFPTELRNQAMAVGELGAGLVGGITSQLAGATTGLGRNIYDLITSGQINPTATRDAASQAAQMFSYQPTLPSAISASETLADTLGQLPPIVSGINPAAMTLPRGTLGALKSGVVRDIDQFSNDIYNAQRGITPGYPTLGSEFSDAFVTPKPTVYEMLAGIEPSNVPSTASAAVKPEGNLNFTPSIRTDMLKGPETQTVSSLLNQLPGIPGLTASGLEHGLTKLRALDPNQTMSKAALEDQLSPSQYEKVDLMGKSNGDIEHLVDDAMEQITPYEALDAIGVPRHLHADIQDFLALGDNIDKLSPDVISPELRTYLERNGMFDRDLLDERVYEAMVDLAHEQARDLADADGPSRGYQDSQRLIEPDFTEDTYFEIGVKDPRYEGKYRHYEGAPAGTIGHIRGSFLPEPYMDERVQIGNSFDFGINDPGAMLIEEIQSDANKGAKQTGPLHQVHGVLFKAAIQHALENGAKTVYMPTALPIADVRNKPSSAYSPIYDQQIVKEGIGPLKKIPGVTVTDMFDDTGKNKMMHKIDFTSEAIERILKGEGQKLPGYKIGGHVDGGSVRKLQAGGVQFADDADQMRYELSAPFDMKNRATILPIKHRADADWQKSVMATPEEKGWDLAIPGLIASPINAYARGVQNPNAEDALEVAGAALGTGLAGRSAPVRKALPEYYHGSDVKGLSVLDPALSVGRRSEGSSIWVTPDETFAAGYPKKQTGSIYSTPLDTSKFAKVDANFSSNKAINPDAKIYHSNGDITSVSDLGKKVTTDQLAAYARSKGDPGLRILNVGDMGSGQYAGMGSNPSAHGESIAVFRPLKVSGERNVADVAKTYKKAEGGAVTDTLDKMVKNPQASTLLNLDLPNLVAMQQQAKPLKRGGRVEFANNIDAMRLAISKG